MTWLVTHMWIALVATSALTLLLGWSVRGMMLSGKMRQAIVERDMVKVELGSAREEVEKLFTQIRKLSNGDAPAGSAQDPILVRKVESLTAELARKSAEIEALKTAAAAAPLAPAAPVAVPNAGKVDETLVWRNRHLESRVVHLEAEIAKAAAAPVAAPVPAAAVDAAPPADTAKLDWEVKYLRIRVEALQTELAAVPVPAPAPVAEAAPVVAEPAAETAALVEEEIARLRWRVRFLEGRLAYFEGNGESEAAPPASAESAPAKPRRVSEAILGELEAADDRA